MGSSPQYSSEVTEPFIKQWLKLHTRSPTGETIQNRCANIWITVISFHTWMSFFCGHRRKRNNMQLMRSYKGPQTCTTKLQCNTSMQLLTVNLRYLWCKGSREADEEASRYGICSCHITEVLL